MRNLSFAFVIGLVMIAVADVEWQFTIEDHPEPVTDTGSGTSTTRLDGFSHVDSSSFFEDVSAYSDMSVRSPGSNLRSDPLGCCIIIR